MKKITLIIAGLLVLTSCSSTFYQVYKISPSDNTITKKSEGLVYEDTNCVVTYNLWAENGHLLFTIYNKSNEPIFIHLSESFFIKNKHAHNYYKDRQFTSTRGNVVSTSQTSSVSSTLFGVNIFGLPQANKIGKSKTVSTEGLNTSSVSRSEEAIITIPPKSYKVIDEYSINALVYRDCDLYLFPTRNQVKKLNFNQSNSPIVLNNRISYTVGESNSKIQFENTFFVSEIGNYPESEITVKSRNEICGQKTVTPKLFLKDSGADKFYIKYTKGNSKLKH